MNESQTKDYLSTAQNRFGSSCLVSDQFCEKIAKMGVMEQACELTLVKDAFSAILVQVVPELVELCHCRSKVVKNDTDIGKVDPEHLYEVLSQMDLEEADALFVSCTALPVLQIIDRLEKKFNKPVLSSNQALIWDTLEKIGKNTSINGFGKLFLTN